MVRPNILYRNLAIVDSALLLGQFKWLPIRHATIANVLIKNPFQKKKSHIQLAVGNIYKIQVQNIIISVIFMRIFRFQFFTKLLTCFVITPFIAYLTIPSNNQGHQPRCNNSIPCMGVWQIYRDTDQPQEKEPSQNESRLQFSWRQFQQQK